MARPLDRDLVTALASRAAASSGEQRAIYLQEIEVLLAQSSRDPDVAVIRAEVRRMTGGAR